MRQGGDSFSRRRRGLFGRRWITGIWLVGTLCAFAPVAQASEADESEAIKPHATLLEEPSYAGLKTAWREVQADLQREAWVEATGRLAYLVDLRTDLGLPNLPEFASVLMHAAHDAAGEGAVDAAASLADAASVLAPDLVSARLAVARHHFQNAPLGLTATIRPLRTAFERLDNDLPGYMALVGNGAASWTDLVILLSLLFAVAMTFRYTRFAASDLLRVLPPGVTLVQAEFLLFMGLMTPIATGLGVVVTVTVWLVVFASYYRFTERIAAMALVLAIATIPVATQTVVRALTYAGQPASVFHRCNQGLCGSADRALILQWAQDRVHPYESQFVTALTHARDAGNKGDTDSYELAKRHAEIAVDMERTRESLTLLGNVAYMRGLQQCAALKEGAAGAIDRIKSAQREAITHWKSALEHSPGYLPALYNSSITLTQLGEHSEADPLLERAMRADHDRVLHWNKTVSRDASNLVACKMGVYANRQIMTPGLPGKRLRRTVMTSTVPSDGLVVPFSTVFTGRLGTRFIGLMGLGGALLMAVLWLLARTLRPTLPCTVCGNVAVSKSRLDTQDGPVCGACVKADVRRAFVDAKKQWFEEKRLHASAERRGRLARMATWLVPGFGHLIRGRPLRGLLFLAVIIGCLMSALGLHSLVDDPLAPLGAGPPRVIAFAIPGVLFYLLAIIDAHTGESAP